MFSRFRREPRGPDTISALYGMIVAQARLPCFYRDYAVADTVNGRFDLIVLGTPSTVATVSGEAFYYISQTTRRPAAFMPYEVQDQRVIAVYFDKTRRVERLANYGYKDGKVFDFVSQTTATGGRDLEYLRNVLKSLSPKLPS